VKRGFPRDLRPETTKLQGGKSHIMSHDATHSHARDMGPTAYERARQTAYTVKRLSFSNGFLVTFCRGNWGNRPIFLVFGSRINAQACYGHGTNGI
jgi:hypothetical protein